MAWDVSGVKEDRFRRLAYNAASETVLAEFERDVSKGHRVGSIYLRLRSSNEYTKLFGPDDHTSASSVVVAEEAAVGYFLIWTHSPTDPRGADWKALARIDLADLTVTEVLQSFAGDWEDAWMYDLSSVSANGGQVICKIGRPRARAGGYTVDHLLCRVDVETGRVEALVPLQDTFF